MPTTNATAPFVFGGTPDFLLDTRRGLYSYAALQSRLAENTFATAGLVDYSGPVLRLASLSPEDFYVLLTKLRHVYASGDPAAYLLPDEALRAYMAHCHSRVGDAYFRTPRNTVKGFLDLLAVLEQNPGHDWRHPVNTVEVTADTDPDLEPLNDSEIGAPHVPAGPARISSVTVTTQAASPEDDDLASFRL